ncbi:MFS transporter [[Clostridium] polysaccharolyticum]|uniref:MFS transporter, FSR family, fosmidomycin resistance protein n=1 Tax=[Clostridium] polysaccharolyticum TaxID=29364 RepID=A0A1I0EVI9_9FIRM|nr:hypothetical protein [[Clostridium] polysaccharolyticum]SET49153.1 MFS transporter, FSR family, fosmidomycin resistance protein [[Clostridium] polysaccharolyticum]
MKNRGMIVPYSLAHFLVDFACANFMFRYGYSSGLWYILVILYNFCAFAMQMPFGLIVDKWNKNALCAASGCIFVAGAYLVSPAVLPAVVVLGIGNALFHVGGGTDVLNSSTKKASMLGIFVSPGAFGIYYGTMLGKQGTVPSAAFLVSLAVMAILIAFLDYLPNRTFLSNNVPVSFQMEGKSGAVGAVACFFLVVLLRSYMGMKKFEWGSQWGNWLICAVVSGKAAGGIIGDIFGLKRTAFVSLSIAAILFVFCDEPVLGIAAIFLFNMTMPITLWAVAKVLKGCRGFSFGLLTVALFLGMLPSYFADGITYHSLIESTAIAFVSLCVLMYGLKKVKE